MNALVDSTIEPLMVQLGEWSVRWAILIVLIAAWLLLARPKNARLRYSVCLGALVLGLFLPVLPRWGPGIAGSRTIEDTAITRHAAAVPLAAVLPISDPEREEKAAVIPMAPVRPGEVEQPFAPSESLGSYRIGLLSLTAAWLVGVAYSLLRWLTGVCYLNSLRRTARTIDGPKSEMFAACLKESGLRRRVRLGVHTQVDSPVALGPWRPTVIVPATWFDQPEELVRASIGHELAHLSRRDDWMALLFQSMRCLVFFHPGVRWLLARLECEREIICDEIALTRGIDAQSYANLLLQLAGRPGRLLPPALPFGPRRTIKARIDQILESPMNKAHWSGVSTRVVGLVALVFAFTAGGWTWRAPEKADPGILIVDAEDTPEQDKSVAPPKPKVPKDELRYCGQSFKQWCHTLEVDLSPQVRQQAFEALCVLGQHGYGKDALKVILDCGREYDVYSANSDDQAVARSASAALARMNDSAIPELLNELKTGSKFGRRLAAYTLRWGSRGEQRTLNDGRAIFLNGDESFRAITRSLASALPGLSVRSKEIVDTLLTATASNDQHLRFDAIAILAAMGDQASSAVPRLVELFADPHMPTKTAAVQAVTRIGGDPKVVIPGLGKLIAEETDPETHSYYPIVPLLSKLGKSAQELVPTLIAQYSKTPASAKKLTIVISLIKLDLDKAKLDPIVRDFLPQMSPRRGGASFGSADRQTINEYARKNNIDIGVISGGLGDRGID